MIKKYILMAALVVTIVSGVAVAHVQKEQKIATYLEAHQDRIQSQVFEYGEPATIQYDTEAFELISGHTSVDTQFTHEGSVTLELFNTEVKRSHTYTFPYQVQDTAKPTLHGVRDLVLLEGSTERPKITATDVVDGDIDVTYDQDVDYNKVGSTKVTVSATDKHGNATTAVFTVTIEPKPVPKQPIVVSSKPKASTPQNKPVAAPSSQPRSSIRFDQTGEVIRFAHAGIAGGMAHIDTYTNQATTWEVIGPKVHSNTDGAPTYIAGHVSDAFRSLPKLKMGSTITVVDHTGHTQTYVLYNGFTLDVEDSGRGNKTVVPKDPSVWNRIYDMDGVEGITLQTCTPNNTQESIYIVQAKPI